MSQNLHPFAHILTDCLSIIISYHTQRITHTHTITHPPDTSFCRRFIQCYDFDADVHVGKVLEMLRGKNLQYVSAKDNRSITNDTFKLFRGVKELNLECNRNVRLRFTSEAFENLHGIETLNVNHCAHVKSRDFIHLRGVKDLSIRGIPLNTEDLVHLRGIRRLNMAHCYGSYASDHFENLRGIEFLDISGNDEITGDAFINFRGISDLHMDSCPQVDDDAFVHLRGIKGLSVAFCQQLSDNALKEVIGVEVLDISHSHQWRDEGLKYIRGVREINISDCPSITDKGLRELRGAHTVKILGMRKGRLTENGMKNVRSVRVLLLESCRLTSDATFLNFRRVEHLHLDFSTLSGVTDEAFRYLPHLKLLSLLGTSGGKFTKRLLQYVSHVEHLWIHDLELHLCFHDVEEVLRSVANIRFLHVNQSDEVWQCVLERRGEA